MGKPSSLVRPARAGLTVVLLYLAACTASPSASARKPDPALPAAADASAWSPEQDPVRTDGDKYRVVLENEQVRVLRYHDRPGDRTHLHRHREFVLYALGPFERRLTFPDGSTSERSFATGDVIWMPQQTHLGENTGTTDTEVLIVEIKRP